MPRPGHGARVTFAAPGTERAGSHPPFLDFDESLFRRLISWQASGGAEAMPLAGSYALGIEPWTTRFPLEQAVAAGEAVAVASGEQLTTTVRATLGRLPDAKL